MRNARADVIIIGAGMAGLACARMLLDHGLDVRILEAREDLGGRVRTHFSPHLKFPLELGAEFIHGAFPASLDFLHEAGMPFFDMGDGNHERRNGKLVKVDFWKDIEAVIERCRRWKKSDISFSEFLILQKNLKPKVRAYARAYVEGFHSADPDIAGIKSIVDAEGDSPELNGQDSFRLIQGYHLLAERILSTKEKSRISFNTEVAKISWSDSGVQVEAKRKGRKLKLRASSVVITVPVGVLKQGLGQPGAIELDPRPRSLDEALDKVQMGAVTRIVFLFKRPFWEKLTHDPIGFLHADSKGFFPTWWTMFPVRVPVLVAWQGGPRSWHLSQMSEEQRVTEALTTLSQMTGKSIKRLRAELREVHAHDWNQDPYSHGAYSYVGVDGLKKASRLAKPFGRSLYFAGEGTQAGPMRGTVNGAITSGERAAAQLIRSRGKK